MPTRLHLEILTGTYKFHDFFRYDIGWGEFSLYRMTNRWGGEKVVCIYQSSKKCYRVMYGKKRFHHTTNLVFKEKEMLCMDNDTFEESIEGDFEVYKKDDKGRTFYRSKQRKN